MRGNCSRVRTGAAALALIVGMAPALVRAVDQLPPDGPRLARPMVHIVPTETAPKIDGVLDDPGWMDAVGVRPLTLAYEARFAPYEAEAWFTYDAENLYVAMRGTDMPSHLVPPLPPPDTRPYQVELLIATGGVTRVPSGMGREFHKVAVNASGEVSVTQPHHNAAPWQAPVQAALHRAPDAWTAEFAVPFAATNLPRPGEGSPWRVNVGIRPSNNLDYTAWAATYAWFYEAQYFGEVHFAGPGAVTAELLRPSQPGPGAKRLAAALTNRSTQPRTCSLVVALEQSGAQPAVAHRVSPIVVPPGERVEVVAPYSLSPDGVHGVVTASVYVEGNPAPVLRQSIPVELPENLRTLREIAGILAGLPAPEELAPPWYAQAHERLGQSLDTWNAAPGITQVTRYPEGAPSRSAWLAAAPMLKQTLGQARKLAWLAAHWQAPELQHPEASFAVGVTHGLDKLDRDRAFSGALAQTVALSAAGGEYESAQLVLVPLGKQLRDVRFTAGPLLGPGGAQLPPEAVTVQWVEFVETRPPRYPIEEQAWYADPLIPWDAAPRTVPEGRLHQPLWVTVRVPRGTPPGVYHGEWRVGAEGTPDWTVAVHLHVYEFTLPERGALQTSLWLNEQRITSWYGWDTVPDEVRREQSAFLLKYRINPTWFAPIGGEDDVEFQLAHGMNAIMIGHANAWPMPEEDAAALDRWYAFVEERGLLDMAYIYGPDEPDVHTLPRVRQIFEGLRKRYPGVRLVCTAYPPLRELEGVIDTWVVGPNLFNEDAVAERVTAGDELWIYLSASVRRPYVTQLHIDYTGLENRLFAWLCWKYGATGFLYWGINEWDTNNRPWSGSPEIDSAIRAGKRWPETPWNTWTYLNYNGEAQYVYPGPDGEFWSSVRLEIMRDAFEDYDYLALLEAARDRAAGQGGPQVAGAVADATRLLELGPPLLAHLTQATADPMVLLRHRAAVAECIEEIGRLLDRSDAEDATGE